MADYLSPGDRIDEYMILTESNPQDLTLLVCSWLRYGWQPHGSHVYDPHSRLYSQAITRTPFARVDWRAGTEEKNYETGRLR
jgi:hypothetical protein